MSNTFFQGGEKFSRGTSPLPCYGPASTSTAYVTSVMKNVLSNKNVVQMLIFALQKNIWKRNY